MRVQEKEEQKVQLEAELKEAADLVAEARKKTPTPAQTQAESTQVGPLRARK